MRGALRLLACALPAVVLPGCGRAEGAATPNGAALEARLARARPGETIRLAPGDYGTVTVPPRTWSPAIRIVGAGARFSGLTLEGLTGVVLRDVQVAGEGVARGYGIYVNHASDVRIEGARISVSKRGIVVNESRNVQLIGNRLAGLTSEGINLALSRDILVRGNVCRDFNPTVAVFDAAGNRVRDGDHPDCIQAWSRPSARPTGDIVVEDNDIEGRMQGIFFGNHVRDGVDDGGFDRVTIRHNRVRVSYPNGIVLSDGRDSVVTGNIVSTVPGSTLAGRPGRSVRANLRVSGERNTACGNTTSDVRGNVADQPCAAPAGRR